MGIIVTKQNSKNTELTERISADLRTKAVATDFSDQVNNKNSSSATKKTSRFSWFWIVLVSLAIVSGSFIVLF